jgi:tRNA U34 5-carboxymethylaminomethyl modifying GTPase MnmE/TrmE
MTSDSRFDEVTSHPTTTTVKKIWNTKRIQVFIGEEDEDEESEESQSPSGSTSGDSDSSYSPVANNIPNQHQLQQQMIHQQQSARCADRMALELNNFEKNMEKITVNFFHDILSSIWSEFCV